MESRANRCRAKAVECEKAAGLSGGRDVKQMDLGLAHQWRELAEQVELLDYFLLG
jgi:hypothetical protein